MISFYDINILKHFSRLIEKNRNYYTYHTFHIPISDLIPGTKDQQNQYLLLVLVFSNCSFCLACHSSSSTLAFSFHSASCLREFLSVETAVEGVFKNWIQRWQRNNRKIHNKKNYELFSSKTKLCFVLYYLAPPASPFAPPSTCVGFQAQLEAGLHWR